MNKGYMPRITFFPEQKLIHRIESNDRAVLGELFVRYEKLVVSFVTSQGGDQADAEDMLQEAIVVLWQKVCSGNFELTSKLSTYILAIVKNKWRAETRKRSKLSHDAVPPERTDDRPSVLDSLIEKENADVMRTALGRIHSPCRELLILFYFEERSLRDIARILGFANTDVVKSKKYQCKKSLQAVLKKLTVSAERRV